MSIRLTRAPLAPVMCALAALIAPALHLTAAASHPSFAGAWTLNRPLSEFPESLAFDPYMPGVGTSSTSGGRSRGGGRGGGGGGGGGGLRTLPVAGESEVDFARTKQLVDEVLTPPVMLTIAQSDGSVSVTDDHAHTRTFHTNGKDDLQTLDAGGIVTRTKWDGRHLVVDYHVFEGQILRYTYSRETDQASLVVLVQFVQKGNDEQVTRVYDPHPSV